MALNLENQIASLASIYLGEIHDLTENLRRLQESSSDNNAATMADVRRAIAKIQAECEEKEKIFNDSENEIACVGF